ncbi:hypothetical protein GALMADRAFT_300678 [Galerina marginata CBS 339.88]|uniref:Uncharacterized protein n=1 Tax=Galerina marginata (strain CBS 339.88) TaxID=685588 RepID=A0A067TY79_GALM3|nr:hypothetical protein GALMADRAFT_300678 [Galerina marginata CBS 339.88]
MTEYDYSPEGYERFLATQNRIANWVDQTEQSRPQFEHPFQPGSAAGPSMRPGNLSYDSHRKLSKRSPPASPTHPYPPQMQQPRQLFPHPPAPGSESSDDYGDGPGPMPLQSPGMVFPPQQPAFHPMGQPMLTPPPMMMPPTYMTAPHHKSHRHRSSHPHSRSRSQQPSVYYSMVSPPVSPGYQYAYPQMVGGGHPGYVMMQPQHHYTGRQMPLMSDLPQPTRSAPPNVTTFSVPPANQASGGYFQLHPNSAGPSSAFSSPASTPFSPPEMDWSYGIASPSHSVMSASTGTVSMTAPPSPHYFTGIPQYQGIHSAMASPTYIPGPSQPAEPLIVPPSLHQRVYDLSRGSKNYLRRSVG